VVNDPVQARSPLASCVRAYTTELWVFSHQDRGLVHCTVHRFGFPEEVLVIGSIASGWSSHVLCMDHCPMALGLLKEGSSVLRHEEDMEWMDGDLLICTIHRAFLLEKGWEWSVGEHA
jgi:hypothetical protein